MHLHDLFTFDLFDEMLDSGYIRRQWHPNGHIAILNYTEKATYERVWNEVTMTCRGLVYDWDTQHILARPFRKFFNYGEPGAEVGDLFEPACVTDKIDGSLGILFYNMYEGRYEIATRGSFTSEQAIHATGLLNTRYAEWHPPNIFDTYLFEIVYPENRIVIDYHAMDDLVLLGTVNNRTGVSKPPFEIWDQWPGPITMAMPADNLAQALELEPRPNAEGVVVHFLSSDKRVKIKQDDYVVLHRLITGMNARVIWEHLGQGETIGEICERVPEEFWPWIERTGTELILAQDEIAAKAKRDYMWIVNTLPLGWTRRDFAEQAVKSDYRPYLFMILDNRDPSDAIWKTLKPSAERALVNWTEDAA